MILVSLAYKANDNHTENIFDGFKLHQPDSLNLLSKITSDDIPELANIDEDRFATFYWNKAIYVVVALLDQRNIPTKTLVINLNSKKIEASFKIEGQTPRVCRFNRSLGFARINEHDRKISHYHFIQNTRI
jgi:hypothetical protein